MIKITYKRVATALFVLCLLSLLVISVIYRMMSLDQYPRLDSCLRASVSKKILCSQSDSYVRLESISEDLIQPIITSEDDKFYFHKGFDWKELRSSIAANSRAFSFIRGGSTITQQLVKNIYLSQKKSIIRKIKEAILAHQIEQKYPKSLILEKYLNAIEFGSDIWGIKNASQHYFSKEPRDLVILEGLYLSTLLPNPKRYSKSFKDKKLTPYLKKRMKRILYWLKRKKYLDEIDYATALDHLDFFPWNQKSIVDIELYDFESVKDVESVKNIEDVEDVEIIKDVENIKDVEDVEIIKDVENIKDVEDVEIIEDVKNIEDVEDVEIIESVKNIEDVEDVEIIESVKNIEDVEIQKEAEEKKKEEE